MKVKVPSLLSLRLPSPEATLRSTTERLSPSTSEALASSWTVEKEKEVSSSEEPRSMRPSTTGASLTGLMVSVLLVALQARPSETS